MRARGKVILSVLLQCPREATRTQLVKWLFLLRQESPLKGDPALYDFTPYRYGPFSFEAYRDLETLGKSGFLDRGVLRIPAARLAEARDLEASLPTSTRQAVAATMARYGACTTRQLLAVVYQRYPWYASRSALRPAPVARRHAPLAVYTIGYEGRSVDRFLDELQRTGLSVLVDVRGNPLSRKYGFSGTTLRRLAGNVGVGYSHFPQLGVPSVLRKKVDSAPSLARLLDHYERAILPKAPEAVEQVRKLVVEQPSALLCFEADANSCHRGRLANRLAELTHLPVVHL